MKIVFIHDPAHGWLRVPLAEIARLGIGTQISSYSYQDTKYAYLEEDQDMQVYL